MMLFVCFVAGVIFTVLAELALYGLFVAMYFAKNGDINTPEEANKLSKEIVDAVL